MYFSGATLRLEVSSRIWASTGVVVLLEVRLEGRGTGAVLGLVTKSGASAGHEVIVVFVDARLALLHAPEDESDTAEEESTADSTDHASNDLFLGCADAASTVLVV
jgi:hypothetical protein